MRNAYKILDKQPNSKRPLERSMHRWEDNMEMDIKEVGQKCVGPILCSA
jgi:hypothetical protein